MTTINVLETKPSSRYDEFDPSQDGNKNTTFADLIIDGKSLYQMLKRHDLVPALGWGTEENQRQMIQYFLLKEPHEYLYYRLPILVCPWCGDEECGYISVKSGRGCSYLEGLYSGAQEPTTKHRSILFFVGKL